MLAHVCTHVYEPISITGYHKITELRHTDHNFGRQFKYRLRTLIKHVIALAKQKFLKISTSHFIDIE